MASLPPVSLSIESPSRRKEARFALCALLRQLGIEPAERPGSIRLHYGGAVPAGPEPTLWIRASRFFEEYGTPRSLPRLPLPTLDRLPVLYVAEGHEPAVARRGPRLETTADLAASTFFLLSGYEETVDTRRDAHGRFTAAHAFQGRARLLLEPLVDAYATLLGRLLGELANACIRPLAWDGQGFALALSHDVDGVKRPAGRTVVDPVLSLEAEYGVRSTFYFLASQDDPVKPRYTLEDAGARRALRSARARGCEIGLHGSYWCLERPGALEAERAALASAAREPRGFRQHYLRLPATAVSRVDGAGFLYDSSMGWPDAIGFRNGTARPFHPFDFESRHSLELVEIPLILMDRTIQKHLRLDPEAAWSAVASVVESVRRASGCASVLWHPEFFDRECHPGYTELYARILGWLSASGGRALTGTQAARSWKSERPRSLSPG